MITPLQLSMIRFELKDFTKQQIYNKGVRVTINHYLNIYGIEPTKKNYNSILILINNLD